MPESYLNYRGLKPGQHSWYWNRRYEPITVYPGDWVRLDLSSHSEVQPAIQAGTAIIEESAPCDIDVLDDTARANGNWNEYGKVFPPRPARRPRSGGQPEVYGLTVEQLGVAARCFLPWPGWQGELDGLFAFSEVRPHRRGARTSISLPIPFDTNFPILHRIAELICRHWLFEVRQRMENQIDSSWASGEYDSKRTLRKIYERRQKLPPRRAALGELLRLWQTWSAPLSPSPRSLRRYRAALGTDRAVRAYADEQILDAVKSPGQRILMGPATLAIGDHVPNRAAAATLTTMGAAQGTVIIITPSYEERARVSVVVKFESEDILG